MPKHATKKFGGSPAPSLERVAADLESRDYRIRSTAVGALGQIGDGPAIALLCEALNDPRKKVRARAAQVLGRLRAASALGALERALRDKTATVRKQAVDAVGKIGADSAVDLILPMVRDTDCFVKYKAVEVLGTLRTPRMVEPLLAAVDPGDPYLVQQTLLCLAPLQDLRTVPFLCNALKMGRWAVSHLAARQLHSLGDVSSLPRAILRAGHLAPQFRLESLEALRGVRYGGWFSGATLRYPLPPIPEYCARLASTDPDNEVRAGARQVRDHALLLRGSNAATGEELLRATGAPQASHPEELLRASDDSEPKRQTRRPSLWRALFWWRQEG